MQNYTSTPANGTVLSTSGLSTATDKVTGQRAYTYTLQLVVADNGTHTCQVLVNGEKVWVNYNLRKTVIQRFDIV